MKIRISYEDRYHPTFIEVPEDECELWVEQDYRRRLDTAADKKTVHRRTPQQIMDEECNQTTFNNEHAETRRHVSFDALDPKGDTLMGDSDVKLTPRAEYADLYYAIDQLSDQQKALLQKVFWEKTKKMDIAKAEESTCPAISMRLARIYSRLKKIMENEIF